MIVDLLVIDITAIEDEDENHNPKRIFFFLMLVAISLF